MKWLRLHGQGDYPLDREAVEQVMAGWGRPSQPLLISLATTQNLIAAAGGWFSCPQGMFCVVGLEPEVDMIPAEDAPEVIEPPHRYG